MKFEGGAILKFNLKIPFPYHWQADENQILAQHMCRGGIPPKIALPSSYVCSPPEIMRHYRPRGTVAFLPLKSTQPNPEVLGQVLPLDGASTLGAQCCNCPCLHHLRFLTSIHPIFECTHTGNTTAQSWEVGAMPARPCEVNRLLVRDF